jgi:hypothetical protein
MADTNHLHATPRVEGDGLSYSGIVWFVVILTVTTLLAQLLVWGAFEWMEARADSADTARAPLAAPPIKPSIQNGRLVTGTDAPALPAASLVEEPAVLREFRVRENENLSTYGWVDQSAGTVRIPIDRAKDLVIERGLPTRPGAPPSALAGAPAPATTTTPPPTTGNSGH